MKNQLIFLLCLATLIMELPSCKNGTDRKDVAGKRTNTSFVAEGYIVKPSTLDQFISVSGTLKPFEETVLMPDVSGRVISINLPEGKFVKKGTILVKLFDDDLQASLKKLQTQLSIAEQTEKRQHELLQVSGISQLEYDQTDLQVKSIKDDIEYLKAQISKTEVVAPFDGVIGLRNVSIGAQVTPSISLATIRMINQLKLDFSVPEKYSKEVVEGKRIQFTVQGDDKKYEGKVTATEESIELNTRNLKVRAVVSGISSSLKSGAYANVELDLKEDNNALMIPTQAIIPQERNKKVIVVKDGKATFVTVKTGIRQASKVEVTEGLQPGDTIATTGILFIKPNGSVKFSKVITN
ncbi:MAG: efflux RND transporter periplasmic adaptor subunit [Bacteroidota bacterium]